MRHRSRDTAPTGVVAIGASAGGLMSLERFFSALSPDAGAAFVVLQHLSPDVPSMTPDLIAGYTSLGTRTAEDGAALQPGEVVFLPPARTMRMQDGVLVLGEPPPSAGRASVIDIFFESMAADRGPRARRAAPVTR